MGGWVDVYRSLQSAHGLHVQPAEDGDHGVEIVQSKALVGGVDEIVDQSNSRASLSVFDDLRGDEECQTIEPLDVRFQAKGQFGLEGFPRRLLLRRFAVGHARIQHRHRPARMDPRLFVSDLQQIVLQQFLRTDRFQTILRIERRQVSR